MFNLLLVGSGGFIGSVLRYLIGQAIHLVLPNSTFSYGTLVANITGCFFIGLFNGLAAERMLLSPHIRLFLFTGILGGFTTFSTFSLDTYNLLRDHNAPAFALGALHIAAHVLIGLLAVYIGHWLAKTL